MQQSWRAWNQVKWWSTKIGIARALYKQASILVFDEATSALDNATEESVMKSINMLSRRLTIIMIAHRLVLLRHAIVLLGLKVVKLLQMDRPKIFYRLTTLVIPNFLFQ